MKNFFTFVASMCLVGAIFSNVFAEMAPGSSRTVFTGIYLNGDGGVHKYQADYPNVELGNVFLSGGIFMGGGIAFNSQTNDSRTVVIDGVGLMPDTARSTEHIQFPVWLLDDQDWLSSVSLTNDEFATSWMVDRKLDDMLNFIEIVGRKDFIERYDADPPTNLTSAVDYLRECVVILSGTEVPADVSEYTNLMSDAVSVLRAEDGAFSLNKNAVLELKSAVSNVNDSIVELLDRPAIGSGDTDLDWILNMDIDSMSMVEMRRAFRAIVLFIKNGNTDGVDDN